MAYWLQDGGQDLRRGQVSSQGQGFHISGRRVTGRMWRWLRRVRERTDSESSAGTSTARAASSHRNRGIGLDRTDAERGRIGVNRLGRLQGPIRAVSGWPHTDSRCCRASGHDHPDRGAGGWNLVLHGVLIYEHRRGKRPGGARFEGRSIESEGQNTGGSDDAFEGGGRGGRRFVALRK